MVARTVALPNVRKIFVPDTGYLIADADLAGADARVVAWEANDEELKDAFNKGLSIHAVNSRAMFGDEAGEDGRAEPYYTQCKVAVHATNYGATPPTLAGTLGWRIKDAESFQRRWFELHPGIKDWQENVGELLARNRSVSNKFGYRIIYFDRIESLLNQALAWVPQSTVAIACWRGALELEKHFPEIQMLIQVHDSLVFQYPKINDDPMYRKHILSYLQVPIPYDDPLIIPWNMKVSERSWS